MEKYSLEVFMTNTSVIVHVVENRTGEGKAVQNTENSANTLYRLLGAHNAHSLTVQMGKNAHYMASL